MNDREGRQLALGHEAPDSLSGFSLAYCYANGLRTKCAAVRSSTLPMSFFTACSIRVPLLRLFETLAVACAAIWLLAGCEAKSPPLAAPTPQDAAVLAAGDIRRLDALITPATVFPDPAQRALYEMHAPASDGGRRSYVFELKAQPGMVASRHFHLITITWARAGTFVGADGAPRIGSTGGPGGAIVDAVAQTADKTYDVQVSEAMLLPETVQISPFDLTKTAAMLAQSYGPPAAGR